jgi:hypothetical protein
MNWSELHSRSSGLAFKASRMRSVNRSDAEGIYRMAADLEVEALDLIPSDKARTKSIIGVSAASLLFKAGEYRRAEDLSLQLLNGNRNVETREQLQAIIQAVWNEDTKRDASVRFLPGQVIVSISGGEVVTGGAPLDLIVSKVQNIQSLFLRTIEYLGDLPFRTRGPASAEIRDYCRPWLFQAPAGSYQFAIAVEAPKQSDMFKSHMNPKDITDKFLDIMQATTADSGDQLERVVDREDYRDIFVRLTKNLAPTGRAYEKVRIYSYDNPKEVVLSQDARVYANEYLSATLPVAASEKPATLVGILRALDLDRDWLEIDVGGKHQRVTGLEDAIDDVIGPLVNRPVKVTFLRIGRRMRFLDIEEAE